MSNSIIKGLGFHHIALKANDFEKSVEFYKALGLEFVVSWGEGDKRIAMFDLGDGGRIELFAGGNDTDFPAEGKYMHFAMCCDDVDAAYKTALAAGAVSHKEPSVIPLESSPEKISINIAFVKGPSGELLEFFKQV
ncbi:MAG: VOC family protein [Clostridia bacterium]|nr:VOC family protein [Clostridia bacterium]